VQNKTANRTYYDAIKLKVNEFRIENYRLENLVYTSKLEISKLETNLNFIRESKIFWLWRFYCNIRELFLGNGKKKQYKQRN